ncbi:hypothetical protein FF38_07835 [Lucilia cuprina]|uniref:Zinc finger PHD-type domain-containing protein n=1 Tax=Lucilia cuprina TaxID=7375 RepID=A0A0L0CDN2_LUCCU|nr:hypothetical protein CVS40_10211 [Lucilia cuprina]KAI8127877.1 hypothetical protein CVS40_2318 [Lucilia cuprina]KNC20965.1 hypothetical protein FF38_09031 [Lucilia cuprina]KNC30508.1 hypothetical protein FF38_07835 [Lucilia cuprina]
MPPKVAISNANCTKCKNPLKRTDEVIKCSFCKKSLHMNCAIENSPGLNPDAAKYVSNNSEDILYKCMLCKSKKEINLSDIAEKLCDMEARIQDIPVQISAEMSTKLDDISNKLNSCVEKVNTLEKESYEKFKQLEMENNSLRKQINRADIIVNGIPTKIKSKNLINVIMGICKHYNIELKDTEINTICWIHNKKAVLIKFNNIAKRDIVMRKYQEKYDLKLNQIRGIFKDIDDNKDENSVETTEHEDCDIEARVFLNDNLTAAASKLKYLGRKLIREKKIERFKLLNYDYPKGKITFKNGSEKILTLEECGALLN